MLPRLRISENGRFFVKEGGAPFLYLGDTEWTSGPGNHWVLVLDDASKSFPAPGKGVLAR